MKNWKVGMKLAISYALMILLLIALVAVSIFSMNTVENAVTSFYNGPFVLSNAVNVVSKNMDQMQMMIYRACSSSNPIVTEESITAANGCAQAVQDAMPVIRENYPGDRALIDEFDALLAQLGTHREEVLALAAQNKNAEGTFYAEANNVPLMRQAMGLLDTIASHVKQKGDAMISGIQSAQRNAVAIFIGLGVLCVVLAVSLCLLITRRLTLPLRELESAARQMADGVLNVQIRYESLDEIGVVSESMRDMAATLSSYITDIGRGMAEMRDGNLNVVPKVAFKGDFVDLRDSIISVIDSYNGILSQINVSADQVAGGAEQVSNGAQALSQGATEQASAVEELAATINEISDQVKSNAENARQASGEANAVGDEMAQSSRQMQDMIAAMTEIRNSSNQIGLVIKTIEDIAFQTNILALNAAVEAARAGESGKGFAVVAGEVRNLATKSADASKTTSGMIESSIHAVENGSKIADLTAQSLLAAVNSVKTTAGTIDKISKASKGQANSIAQVTQGVEQISAVVLTNSATAEQSAAASEELSDQAQALKNLVGRFKLKGQGDPAAPGVADLYAKDIPPMRGSGKYEY